MKKILIGGVYYGQHNIGDEAILFSMIKSFNKNNSLTVATYDSKWIEIMFPNVKRHIIPIRYQKPKFGIYTVPIRKVFKDFIKVKKELAFYRENDIYICGGATILSDCPWYSLRTVQLAGKAKNDVYLWGVGMAEVCDNNTIDYIRKVLNEKYVIKIFTRDEFVKDRLIDIGVDSEKVFVSYDPAIMIESKYVDLNNYLTSEQCIQYRNKERNIVLTISGESDVINKTPTDVIKNVINSVQKKYNANIFMIPTGCGKQCKDLEILCEIENELKNDKITVIKKEFTPVDLVGFLENIDLIVSSRLHMNIFGACASTPSIGLVRNQKIIDFSNLMEMPYFELEKLDGKQLEKCIDDILENNNEIKLSIKNKVNSIKEQYNKAIIDIGL